MLRPGDVRRPGAPPGFFVIWSTVALDLVGFGIVLPVLPLWAEDLGASPFEVGVVVAGFSAAQLVFSPILGRFSDRIGRRPVLLLSLVGTAVGSLLTGLANSVTVLIVARVIDGASGASVSVAQAAVTDVAPVGQRTRLLGLLSAAFGVGFVLGPAIGGLASLGGARLPFFVAAALAGTNAVVGLFRLPETRQASVAATPARRNPLSRNSRRLIASSFVTISAFAAFEATFALLGERRFGLTAGSVSAVFVAIGLAIVLVQTRVVGPTSDRLGSTASLRLALVALGAGLATLSVDGGWPLLVVSLGLLVVGQGLFQPTLTSALAGSADDQSRGAVLGFNQSAGALARVAGPLAGAGLFQEVAIGSPYVLGAVLAGVALVIVPAGPVGVRPAVVETPSETS